MSRLGEEKRLVTNRIIQLEVLTGAPDESTFRTLTWEFEALQRLPLTDEVWERADNLRWQLRRRGLLTSVPDIVIASCALVYECELLHVDRHFDLIAKYAPLQIYQHEGRARR